ncbi:hypothetical protein HHL28_12905 [Aerophototrophica crusticola]|uniref:Uncharacterized protein n=1 Tax=Aerophototrophica crusticola TaxID=1709002 RepID=A0A858R9P4_9PROT|nr:hypothetical protein HHL28_12905 [Rhodospirillaceae bacterium B3]
MTKHRTTVAFQALLLLALILAAILSAPMRAGHAKAQEAPRPPVAQPAPEAASDRH